MRAWSWLHYIGNILKTTELYTFKLKKKKNMVEKATGVDVQCEGQPRKKRQLL